MAPESPTVCRDITSVHFFVGCLGLGMRSSGGFQVRSFFTPPQMFVNADTGELMSGMACAGEQRCPPT